MTSAARAVSPHYFELITPDDGMRLGKLWLTIDHPASERVFYCSWWPLADELRVLEWNDNSCEKRDGCEVEPAMVEALRDFCRASDDVIELIAKYEVEP